MPSFIKHRDRHIDLISYMMLPIQFIKIHNKHKLVLQTYTVHVKDTIGEDTIETGLQ